MYQHLMRKHGWSIDVIDQQDFFKTLDIELGDFGLDEQPKGFIDEVLGF